MNEIIGVRLEAARTSKNISRKEAAAYVGVSVSTFGRYETGESEIGNDTLRKLADYYGVTLDYLFGRTDNPYPDEKHDDNPVSLYDLKNIRRKIANKNVMGIPTKRIPFIVDNLDKEFTMIEFETTKRSSSTRRKSKNSPGK